MLKGASALPGVNRIGAQDHPGYVSGRRYGPICTSTAAGTLAADTLYAQPLPVLFPCTINLLGARRDAGVALCLAKFGLYTLNGDKVVESAADLDMSAAAGNADGTLASSVTLTPGVYWTVFVTNGAAQVTAWNSSATASGGFAWLLGSSSAAGLILAGNTTARATAALTYVSGSAFLPATLPALTLAGGAPGCPYLSFRVA